MSFIRNILALIGLAAVVAVVAVYLRVQGVAQGFDPEAGRVYLEMGRQILESRNAAEASVWKVKVVEGLSPEEVEQTMKFVANEHNISNVGELPLYKDVAAKSGSDYRYVKIFMFCNSLTAAKMLDYSDAFSAYLPCRVTLLEDQQGQLWIYALNMDPMIHGGEPLPADLKEEALRVKEVILDIMNRGASGEF